MASPRYAGYPLWRRRPTRAWWTARPKSIGASAKYIHARVTTDAHVHARTHRCDASKDKRTRQGNQPVAASAACCGTPSALWRSFWPRRSPHNRLPRTSLAARNRAGMVTVTDIHALTHSHTHNPPDRHGSWRTGPRRTRDWPRSTHKTSCDTRSATPAGGDGRYSEQPTPSTTSPPFISPLPRTRLHRHPGKILGQLG